jgi:hypothetical protein
MREINDPDLTTRLHISLGLRHRETFRIRLWATTEWWTRGSFAQADPRPAESESAILCIPIGRNHQCRLSTGGEYSDVDG